MLIKKLKTKLINQFIIIGIIITIIGGGCDDFLVQNPENAITPSNFFQTEEDFRQAVTGVYAPLQDLYDSRAQFSMGEMRSDNTHYFFNPDFRFPPPEQIADFLNGSENEITQIKYFENFDIIARANRVLVELEDAEMDQSFKDNFRGQALFLRALAYFDLVRFYGGVPLSLEPATDLESASLPRSPANEVYDQIITDARTAGELLPSKNDQDPGRATSGAAWTLLADAYLTLEQWENAEEALNNVTGYSLLNNYADIFNPNNKGNDEIIFSAQFTTAGTSDLTAFFPYYFIPIMENPEILTQGPSGSQSPPLSGWNIPTENLLAAIEDTVKDKRFKASIGFHTGPSPITDTMYVNLPYIKKYQHPHSTFGETSQNFPIYRYAEVLLMKAEAINEQGGRLSEAQNFLNQVRNRAGLDDYNASSQTDLRDAILRELRIELMFENKRWPDLVRTGNAIEVMNAYGASIKPDPCFWYLSPNSYNVNEMHLLFPIPISEIRANPELEQNPGF